MNSPVFWPSATPRRTHIYAGRKRFGQRTGYIQTSGNRRSFAPQAVPDAGRHSATGPAHDGRPTKAGEKETDSGNVVARPVPKETTEEDEKDTPSEPQGRKEAAERSAVGKACRKQSEIPAQAITPFPRNDGAHSASEKRRHGHGEPLRRSPKTGSRRDDADRKRRNVLRRVPDKRSERKSGEKSVPESIVPEPKNRYRSEERTAPSGVRGKRTDAPGRVSAPSAPYAPAGTLTRRSARARYSADSCWPD